MKKLSLTLSLLTAVAGVANAQLLFTQYYEGNTGTNKYVELKNVGSADIDLSIYTVNLFTNANTENWKTGNVQGQTPNGTNPTGELTFALSGTLAAGSVLVLGNSTGTVTGTAPNQVTTYTPSYMAPGTTFTAANTVMNFNGNDSVVLWNNTSPFATGQIVDALSFTNSGNEGVDKSFVRLNTDVGYNLTAGSSILNFSSVWATATLVDVNTATPGTNNYLGSSSVTAVPEPGTLALLGLGGLAFFVFLRRSRKATVSL